MSSYDYKEPPTKYVLKRPQAQAQQQAQKYQAEAPFQRKVVVVEYKKKRYYCIPFMCISCTC